MHHHAVHHVSAFQGDDETRGRTIIDDDTSAVVFIAGVIIIAVIASYATYQWVVNNSQEAIKYGFYHSKPYPHAALIPTSSSEMLETPHLTAVDMPLLDMGESQLTLFSGENIHSHYGL